MAAADRTILIVGAGIGGLAAALAIAPLGFGVTVLEQRARLPEQGAGIQLGPNATRALGSLGAAPLIADHAVRPDAIRVRSAATARELSALPLGDAIAGRFGAPYWTLHRAELQDALWRTAAALPGIDVRFGVALDAVQPHEHGVTLRVGSGERLEGAALVGADGLWSRVRTEVGERAEARASGKVAWRALVEPSRLPSDFDARDVGIWLAPGAHVVHYPVRGGALVNIVVVVDDPLRSEDWNVPADFAGLRPHLAGWPALIRDTVEAADNWRRWTLWERPSPARWSHGCITLLGDAAHPMLPFLAQGAAMALEDAVVLGRCIAGNPDRLTGAFADYEGARRTRTGRVQATSRQNGALYHARGPIAAVRDLTLRLLPARQLLSRLDWLYGYDASAAP